MRPRDLKEVFGSTYRSDVFRDNCAQEAMLKLEKYHERQHSGTIQEETFEVGDIVERTSSSVHFKAVIVNVELTSEGDTYITLMFSGGSSSRERLGHLPWTKTGENILHMLSTEEELI